MLTTFSGRRASQDEDELHAFVAFLIERGVKRYLEIGAREGDTFHDVMSGLGCFSHIPDLYGVAIDLPGGLWGKLSTVHALKRAVDNLTEREFHVEHLLGNSTHPGMIAAVHALGPFDAILIDGDHTYEGVKADWENYRDLAPIIAFHDIVGEGQIEKVTRRGVEVPKLWAEIKASGANVVEFISPGSAMGIGVWLAS
jgi:hypothetical protein